MAYDARSQTVSISNQIGKVTSYVFDALGRQTHRQFPDGKVTSYAYDAIGQMVSTVYHSGSRVTMAYDPSGNRTTMTDSVGLCTYAFDAIDRLAGKTEQGLVQAYDYDAVSQRTKLTDPNGGVRTYVFDADGRNTMFQSPNGRRVTATYDGLGRQTRLQFAAGNKHEQTYDAASQMVSIHDYSNFGTLVARMTVTFDGNGNKSTIQELDGSLTTYVYDERDRLTGEDRTGTGAYRMTHVYDSVDNRTQSDNTAAPLVTSFTYDLAGRLTTCMVDGALHTYTFDDNGNMTADTSGPVTMTYDEENRMSRLESGAVISTYVYDGDNLKRTERVDGSVTTIVWDGADYLQEID